MSIESRQLFTTNLLNTVLSEQALVFPGGIGSCDQFSLGSFLLDQLDIVVQEDTTEILPINLIIEDIGFSCELIDGIETIDITAINSNLVVNIDFFSPDFERVIVNNVLTDAPTCPEGIFELETTDPEVLPRLEFLLEIVCPDLLSTIEGAFLGIVELEALADFRVREPQFPNFDEALAFGEENLEFPFGFEQVLGEEEKAEAALQNVVGQFLATPALQTLLAALEAGDNDALVDELQLILDANGVEDVDLEPLLDAATLGPVIDVIGEDTPIGVILNSFGRDLPIFELIPTAFFFLRLLLDGEDGQLVPLVEILLGFLNDVPANLVLELNNAFNDVDIEADDPVGENILNLLQLISILDDSFDESIEQANEDEEVTLREALDIFGLADIEIDLDDFGVIQFSILSFKSALFFIETPAVRQDGIASVIFPEIELEEGGFFIFDYSFKLVRNGEELINDVASNTFFTSFTTQQAFAPAADFEALGQDFGLDQIVERSQIGDGMINFTDCLLESFGVIFTAQQTAADSRQEVDFLNNDAESDESERLFSLIFDLNQAAIGTFIENSIFNLQKDNSNEVLTLAAPETSCRAIELVEVVGENNEVNGAAIAVPIVLIIALVGVGSYYYLNNKKDEEESKSHEVKQESDNMNGLEINATSQRKRAETEEVEDAPTSPEEQAVADTEVRDRVATDDL